MSVSRRITKVGGSLGVLIPRDIAESMGVQSGSAVRLSLVGSQLVVEPEHEDMDGATFQRAFAAVLRRRGAAFQALADHDSGRARR